MRDEILREVCKGKGNIILNIPFAELSTYAHVTIDNLGEFEAVIQDILDSLTDKDWLDLFERGIINKFGFPITYEFAHNLGDEAGRRMVVLKRPVQPGSTKTLVDDSAISRLYVFGDALTDELFGPDFHLNKISILISFPENDDQARHIDYKEHIVRDDYRDSDFAVVMAFKHRGNLIVYDYSQHIVHACAKADSTNVEDSQKYSIVREDLESNEHFKIGVHECERREVFFGTNEMLVFGDNFVHGGAANTMFIPVVKVHFYITKRSRKAPKNQTVVLHNIAWDLTRKGAASKDVIFKDIETRDEYVEYMREKGINVDAQKEKTFSGTNSGTNAPSAAKENKKQSEKTGGNKDGAKTGTNKAASRSTSSDSRADSQSSGAPKRGRPVKVKNRPLAEGKSRGRPKTTD